MGNDLSSASLLDFNDRASMLKNITISTLLYVTFRVIRSIVLFRRWFKFYNDVQGVKDYSWMYGNLHVFPRDFEVRSVQEVEWMKKYPKYNRLWFGPLNPVIRVYHPDTIKPVVKTAEPKPTGPGATYGALIPWLGEGLLIAGGQRWARSRRLLTPAFHFEILKPYVDVTNRALDVMFSKIDEHVKAGTSFDLFNMVALFSFDTLLQCAMSVNENIQLQGYGHPYVKAVNEILDLIVEKARYPPHRFDFIYYRSANGKLFKKNCDYVHEWAEKIITKRQETLKREGPPKSRYLDFLDILLSARDAEGKGLTPLEIRNEVDTFLFEGHDTTTSGISWTIHTLATRPDIQTRVQEELDTVLADRESKHITWDDISKLEYLNLCVKEGNRFHSPVPNISRYLTKPMVIDGKEFPAGTAVSLAIWSLHHNPDVWEDPEKYDPDRFLPDNMRDKDHYAYIPFSAGPRNCIGQHFALNEEKVTIGRIFERYRLEPDSSRKVARKMAAVMKSTEGLWVFAKHRH